MNRSAGSACSKARLRLNIAISLVNGALLNPEPGHKCTNNMTGHGNRSYIRLGLSVRLGHNACFWPENSIRLKKSPETMKYNKAIGIIGAAWTTFLALAIIAFGALFNSLAGMAGSFIGGAPISRVLLLAAVVGGWALLLVLGILLSFRYRA